VPLTVAAVPVGVKSKFSETQRQQQDQQQQGPRGGSTC
jgi:hypothetical protein